MSRRSRVLPFLLVGFGVVVATAIAGAAVRGAGAPRQADGAQARPNATAVTVIDDFETADWPDPDLWQPIVEEGDMYAWAPRNCRARSGQLGLWAIGGGVAGSQLRCRSSYPADIRTAVQLDLDLKPYTSAAPLELVFDMWANTLSDSSLGDFFSVVWRRPDADTGVERVPIVEWTGATGPDFQTWRVNLLDLQDLYDPGRRWNVAGRQVAFEFVFRSAADSFERGEGPSIDVVRLEYGGIPAVVPTPRTPRPTRTATPLPPTPTLTPTITLTPPPPTATRRPSPTSDNGVLHVYLPLAARSRDVRPKAVKSATTLVVGIAAAPSTLYRYGAGGAGRDHLFGAIYDGPIDTLRFDRVPVIVAKLPAIGDTDGSVRLRYVSVEAGERYVDPESGEVRVAADRVDGLAQVRVRFQMIDGVRWEDGTPVTVDDSVFSWRLACDADTPDDKHLCDRTAGYLKIDDRTVEWQGLPGHADPELATRFFAPMPRHQRGAGGLRMDQMTAAAVAADEVFARHPYAYGPFRLVAWHADRIVLVRNPHYWRSSESLPQPEMLVFRVVGTPDDALAALLDGRLDVALSDTLDIGQFDALQDAQSRGDLMPRLVLGAQWEHIDLDMTMGRLLRCQLRLRQAIAQGTDRATMVRDLTRRYGKVLDTFLPEIHWAYPDATNRVAYDYDPERARRLLEDTGFTDLDGDGVRELERDLVCPVDPVGGVPGDTLIRRGTKLAFQLATTEVDPLRAQIAERFRADMHAIGVDVRLDVVAPERFFERSEQGTLSGRRFDLALLDSRFDVQPDTAAYRCSEVPTAATGWQGRNHTAWCNEEYDRLAGDAARTLDRAEALALLAQAQNIWAANLPVLPLFQRVRVAAVAPYVSGFEVDPSAPSETWSIERWRIQLAR